MTSFLYQRVAHSERSEGCGELAKTTPFPLVRECHPSNSFIHSSFILPPFPSCAVLLKKITNQQGWTRFST
jgi:hypothetical protein